MVTASKIAAGHGATALGLVTATRGYEDELAGAQHMVDGIQAVRAAGFTEATRPSASSARPASSASRTPA
jgi:biotin synthase